MKRHYCSVQYPQKFEVSSWGPKAVNQISAQRKMTALLLLRPRTIANSTYIPVYQTSLGWIE